MLEVDALDAWYGKAQILYGMSLRVDAGECVALMGRNGAGKVTYRGVDISTWPSHRIAQLGLGWVPEDRRIFTDLTVRENLSVGRQPPRDGAPHWTEEQLFALFPNLASMTDRPGGRMSGGEQQMLTIARTLMGNPHLILLDEPSEGVAPVIVEQMAQMIVKLKREGLSILLSEQNLHFARLVADRAVVLEKGQVRYADSMQALMADESVQRTYLSV